MQQLHLVGVTTERDALIFSARKGAKSGGFLVPLDDALYDTIDEAGRERDGNGKARAKRPAAPRPESALSPRDIQRRLRAGRSVASVASEAGVDEDWIMRFAVPILAEQALIIGRAQGMTFAKARLGESGRTLGESVWWNVADKGVLMAEDTFDQCWTAQHLRDAQWVVRFDFVNRKKRQRAEWEVDTREGTLSARNRLATELGYVEPGRRGKPPAPLPPAPKPVAKAPARASKAVPVRAISSSKATKKAPAKKTAKKKAAPKRAAAKKTTARRTAPKKTAARKPAAKKTTARKATKRRAAPARRASRRPAPKKVAARAAAKTRGTTRPAKKATPRTATPRKAAVRTAIPRKAAPRKAVPRKAAVRKARPIAAPPEAARFEAPMFDAGEATRPVTIRAPRATEPEPAPAPVTDTVEDAPVPAPPVLTSTPEPVARPAAAERRFGRLRRRRPPGS